MNDAAAAYRCGVDIHKQAVVMSQGDKTSHYVLSPDAVKT